MPTRRQLRCLAGALVALALALTWPLADLAAHWSLTALVVQRLLLTLGAAPLLLLAMPSPLLAALTRPAPLDACLETLTRPVVAVVDLHRRGRGHPGHPGRRRPGVLAVVARPHRRGPAAARGPCCGARCCATSRARTAPFPWGWRPTSSSSRSFRRSRPSSTSSPATRSTTPSATCAWPSGSRAWWTSSWPGWWPRWPRCRCCGARRGWRSCAPSGSRTPRPTATTVSPSRGPRSSASSSARARAEAKGHTRARRHHPWADPRGPPRPWADPVERSPTEGTGSPDV